jgi:hypothetical protein
MSRAGGLPVRIGAACVEARSFAVRLGVAVVALVTLATAAEAATIGFASAAGNSPAWAPTPIVQPTPYSLEGILLALPGTITLPEIAVQLGSDYAVGDAIILTVSGVGLVGGNTAGRLTHDPPGIDVPFSPGSGDGVHCYTTGASPSNDPIIVGFVGVNGNNIMLRVSSKAHANATGAVCRILGIEIDNGSIAAIDAPGVLAIAYAAKTAGSGIVFDTSSVTPVGAVEIQFVLNWGDQLPSRPLHGVVDIGTGLRTFVGSGTTPAANTDFTIVQFVDLATSGHYPAMSPVAQLDEVDLELDGDLGHLADAAGNCDITQVGSAFSVGFVSGILVPAGTSLSAMLDPSCSFATAAWLNTLGTPGLSTLVQFTFDGTLGTQIVAPQTFSGSVTFNYSYNPGTGPNALADFDLADAPGKWTTAAFHAFVGYMPYGNGITQVVYLSNKSTLSAQVMVKANNQAGASCSFAAGTIKPTSVLSLADGLTKGIQGCFGVGYSGKVSFTLNAPLPVGSVELYTAYNANGNRVNVVNSSNGRVSSQGASSLGGNL